VHLIVVVTYIRTVLFVPKNTSPLCSDSCKNPYRDIVLDLGIDGTTERYSEFVTVLVQQIKKLADPPTVTFANTVKYNNSRDEKKTWD